MNRIILLGATGYTGSRVLSNLASMPQESDIVLVGRNSERLRQQAHTAGVECETFQADASVPGALDSVLRKNDVLITTVGPFDELGREVARSAARAGVVYLDSTGEPPFVEWMFRTLGPSAASSGALLVPGFGYDYVPGNLAGWAVAERAGDNVAAIEVAYFLWRYDPRSKEPLRQPSLAEMLSATTTPGTRESLVKVFGAPSFAYRADFSDPFGLTAQRTGEKLLRFTAAGKQRSAITIGGSEHFGLPEVLPSLRCVDVGLGWFGSGATPLHYLVRMGGPLTANRFTRRLSSKVAQHLPNQDRMPSVPTRISVTGRARDASGNILSEVSVNGPGPYELTGDLLARAARHFASREEHPIGVHGPLAALEPATLVALGEQCGLTVQSIEGR
ncbi:saccharopine dehydrogenase NADP-binding domain-containing protein [Nocardia cyriacigeorgica]|uniref:saccharopine dehydrogenase NADP-binding domain-containing protein n=1 Tax=Nocardia cyriacigeorgica TaxID=135487 RepID=UPI0024577F43|nr:saccharopine dehydrogenase NADP-binding domain-containing protein [Nocardia cyriacigeorgica]